MEDSGAGDGQHGKAYPSALPDFRAVFDGSPRPMLLIAADEPRFTMLAANWAHALAFGTTPQALQGLGVLEVFGPEPPPAAADFRDAIRASLTRVMRSRNPDHMPVRPYSLTVEDGVDERYWSAINAPMLNADGEITHIISSIRDVTGEVAERRSEAARSLLMREVDHRARNALTVVQSFIRLTVSDDLDQFRQTVSGRIEALARAQASLAARKWEGASLSEVIEAELVTLCEPDRYCVEGPAVLLPADDVQAISMMVHELATNATKYGALSAPCGTLAIRWTQDSRGAVILTWAETSSLKIERPVRLGFGARLIAQLAQQLQAETNYVWGPQGLTMTLHLADRIAG